MNGHESLPRKASGSKRNFCARKGTAEGSTRVAWWKQEFKLKEALFLW